MALVRCERSLGQGVLLALAVLGFFGYPLGIQGDQPLQDFLIAQRARPAVGGKDGLIEVVVDLPEDADEPLLVNQLLLVRKLLPGAEFFQDVVHPRQRKSWM